MSTDQGALFFTPAEVAELLALSPEEVVTLVLDGELRGVRLGAPAAWRIERGSVRDYLEAQNENSRRHALWHESNVASLPELWGSRVTLPHDTP
ncbi:helix-turn-helix domain-containing protein [Microbacterium amylolyticum]|uniref:Excisionase family DNA binding protein n=1 Tax=Microbacterium amylolyticum TaxID=936337 RepID=A0ABS4ZJZ0_9MICO|nr:helix-turn-helix domain-containing protein [Microbacterium amylolyticum]MBP2437606.1 excisionase family DNA binding protein [Microbacterium amylolyticum]